MGIPVHFQRPKNIYATSSKIWEQSPRILFKKPFNKKIFFPKKEKKKKKKKFINHLNARAAARSGTRRGK